MSTISSGSSGFTWTSDNSSNLAITLTSIVDNTGNTIPASTLVQGSAKAWVKFTASASPTINGSFNVSSITYNGTGDFSINFTTAMSNANYVAAISCGEAGSSSRTCSPYSFSTSSYRFWSYSGANVQLNMPLNSVIIFGT